MELQYNLEYENKLQLARSKIIREWIIKCGGHPHFASKIFPYHNITSYKILKVGQQLTWERRAITWLFHFPGQPFCSVLVSNIFVEVVLCAKDSKPYFEAWTIWITSNTSLSSWGKCDQSVITSQHNFVRCLDSLF